MLRPSVRQAGTRLSLGPRTHRARQPDNFIAIGAVAGAVMMWMDPSGVSWGGGPMLDMLRAKMPWPDVFFKDFIPSGFVLLAVNGVCLVCGIVLMLWIALEWYVWGFVALSNVFFILGQLEAGIAAYFNLKK